MHSTIRHFRPGLASVSALAVLAMVYGTSLAASDQPTTPGTPSAMGHKEGTGSAQVLTHFEQISQVPRCSKHEEQMSAWLVDWAKKRSFPVKTDDRKNVVIAVPATTGYENHPVVTLQAHMDMVCQKTADSTHDFTKDPIVPIRDGEWLRTKDTTLGADDGIGIALALALATDSSLARPPLELLFTTDEEVDMSGAAALSTDFLTGRKFINIDWETEGSMALGSAGGVKSDISLPLTFAPLAKDQPVFSLQISGLLGGHSGLEIHKNRANANVLIAKALAGNIPFRLIRFTGGTAANAITPTAEMIFALAPDQVAPFKARLAIMEQETRKQYPNEPELVITLKPLDIKPDQSASESASAKVVKLILDIPYGVFAWSKEFADLPETSNNIGMIKTDNHTLYVTTYQRSSKVDPLEKITTVIETAAATAGATSVRRGSFPPWPPNPGSDLYKKTLAIYESLFKIPMRTEVVHAGLECGYMAEKYPGIEIISIGPTLENVHTARERLYVPSLDRVWQLMTRLLQDS